MDSPVIVDSASKFGRGIDLDREFPGFNFDDEGFGRRGDFRSHLDDIAARHPEFADHFLGSSWGDIPFHSSLRNRRRGSGSGNNYQNQQDEDTKSQASGSSAASGASAVSSHGDPEILRHETQEPRRHPIPQYGLRNTVDIGQHRMNMDNPQKVNRNQRSMSAPPENRQEPQSQSEQPRFVSRVEITPQQQQQQQEQLQKEKTPEPQPQQSQQQKTQQQGNVRHIPIFVEGRDKPVIPKEVDDVPFPGQSPPSPPFQQPPQYQVPPQFQPPPTFHRPSHYNERFGRQNWPPQFQETFFDQPRWGRDEPDRQFRRERPHNQQPPQPPPQPQYQQKQHPQNQQSQPQYQQPPQQQKQEPEAPKPKPQIPKDPLERVALVQKEVDSLTEQVKNYKGNSRQDKEYIYLDEMLTRELIKLDDIETEGKENVRVARKTAIKTIQDSINLLESMVPLPGQHQVQSPESQNQEDSVIPETMETEQPEEAHNDKPIPLPPGPNSSVSPKENSTGKSEAQVEASNSEENSGKIEAEACKVEDQVETGRMEVHDGELEVEASQNQEPVVSLPTMEVHESESSSENQKQDPSSQQIQESPNPVKSPKKVKKTKKQPTPVSEEPIPLPAPKSNQKGTK